MSQKLSNTILLTSLGVLAAYAAYSYLKRAHDFRSFNHLEAKAKYVQGFGNLIIVFV